MVYQYILIVRGIVISKEDIWKVKRNDKFNHETFEDLLEGEWVELGFGREKFVGGVKLIPWPCCSSLSHEKYILGKIVAKYKIRDILDKECALDNSGYDFDRKLLRLSKKHGFSKTLETILMLDDCTWCS